MTTDKLTRVFGFYRQWIGETFGYHGIEPAPDDPTGYEHLASMCYIAAYELVPAGRIEKAMRWLGFIQGVLVTKHYFTLEDVKKHSMPDDEVPE